MTTLPPDQLASYIFAGIAAIAAGYERFRSNKVRLKLDRDDQSLSEAKAYQQRGDLMAKMAAEYKSLYEREANEHSNTRNFWHEKSGEYQKNMSECNERISELQARPDLSAILKSIEHQGEVALSILEGIKEILKHLKAPIEQN